MRSTWRTFRPGTLALDRATLRDIALVCLADAIVAVSFGAISVSGGLRPWLPVSMSLLVFAGGAQFAAVGVMLAGGSPVAAVLAGLVLNARLLPYSLAVADVLDGPWWTRLAGAHVITDESTAFALRRRSRERRAAFWTCGLSLFAVWNLAVALGALAGAAVRDTAAFGLDAALPIVLLALALPSLADRGIRRAALLGAVLAVAATPFVPTGLPILIALAGLALARRPAARPGQAARPAARPGQAAHPDQDQDPDHDQPDQDRPTDPERPDPDRPDPDRQNPDRQDPDRQDPDRARDTC